MKKKVEGIVDRCGASLVVHGDHDAAIYGRNSNANDLLVALTRQGDHVSFELDGSRVKAETFRNWTLEARLLGQPEHDVSPSAQTKAISDQPQPRKNDYDYA